MRILITGATSGIGMAVAKWLSADHELVLLGRSAEKIARLSGTVRGEWHAVDFSGPSERIAGFTCALASRGTLDAIVHCAGAYQGERLEEINAVAPMKLIRGLLQNVIGGTIVVINSSIVFSAAASSYAESKRLLKKLTNELRAEVNVQNIRVTSIYPGRTATPMQERIMAAAGMEYRPERLLQPEDVAQAVTFAIGLPRTAEIVDLHLRPMHR